MLILAGICLITAAFYLSRTDPGIYPADLVRDFPNLTVQVSDETRLENGKVVVDLYYEVLCPDSRSFVLYQLYPAWQGLKNIFTINYIPYGKARVRQLLFNSTPKSFVFYLDILLNYRASQNTGNLILAVLKPFH